MRAGPEPEDPAGRGEAGGGGPRDSGTPVRGSQALLKEPGSSS